MCKAGASSSVAKGTKVFLNYGLGDGQSIAKQLSFAPLPPALRTKAKAAAAKLKCNGSAVSAT